MQWFYNMKIRYKHLLIFGLLLLVMVSFVAFAVTQIIYIGVNNNELIESYNTRQVLLTDAISDIHIMRLANLSRGYMQEDGSFLNTIFRTLTASEQSAKSFAVNMEKFRALEETDRRLTKKEQEQRLVAVNGISDAFDKYAAVTERLKLAAESSNREEVVRVLEECIPLGNDLVDKMQDFRDLISYSAVKKSAEASDNTARIITIVISIAVAFILLSAASVLLIVRSINRPISKMEKAVAEIAGGNLSYPIRSDRKDELGLLSVSISDMVSKLSNQEEIEIQNRRLVQMTATLERHDSLLNAVNSTAGILLTAKDEAIEQALVAGMETMGNSVDADRVYIMRNEIIDGEMYFTYQYQYVSEFGSQGTHIKKGTRVPYSFDPEWGVKFRRGECMNGAISTMSPNIQNFFSRIQIKSVLVIPIFIEDSYWGLVSFSDCKNERTFTDDEISILHSGALMMVSAINRSAQGAEIREMNDRTRLLLDSMPYACHLWNKDRIMFDCNEENVRLFNLNNKKEVMERFDEFAPEYQPDGRLTSELVGEMLGKAFEDGRCVGEFMHRTSDGEPLPVEMVLVRVPYDGDFVVAAYARDLREHKKMMAEIEQRTSELALQTSMLQTMIDSIPDLIFCKDLNFNYTLCNKYLEDYFNTPKENIIGKGDSDGLKFPAEVVAKILSVDQKVAGNGERVTYEEWIPSFDGSKRLFETIKAPLAHQNSEIVGLVGIARDITERNKMLEEITALQERLWDKVEVGMIIIDAETRVVLDVNPAVCNMYGGDRTEIIGNICHKFFGQHECPILDAGQAMDREERKFTRADGTVIPILKSIAKIQYNGKPALLESFTDIAYLKAAEEQKRMLAVAEQASKAKSEFLANISHEMRTPLNAVLGLSGLTLEMEGLGEEAAINLEKIYNSGSTLLNIVNDILDISKIEAGKLELIPNEYDIPSLLNDVITQNILRVGSKLITFSLDISADIPASLYGDDLRIKQILNNLLSNAFKYTNEGTVELGVRSERVPDGETVWITAWIKDTGMGIRREDIEKLFSDYSQVDTRANRKIEGTGLGLAITKKMLEMMDGTISVESEYGSGSMFTVKFKQRSVTDEIIGETVVNNLKNFRYSNAKRKQSARIKRVKMPYAKVLVVDDNLTNLDVAKGLMQPYGMRIDCVTRGRQAIDAILAEEVRYDAVFMDHMMPEMDGIEAARRIREIGTDYAKNIPIIALTANAIAGNDEKFLSKGFQDFLSKPIDLSRLDEALRRWVRDKSKEGAECAAEDDAPDQNPQPGIYGVSIEGVNFVKGLDRFGGDEEVYLNILRSYAVNTRPILESIKTVNEDNLAEYTVSIHGIKGSSRGIYADAVADLAEKLEAASKSGDIDFVRTCNPKLIDTAQDVINEIERILSVIDKGKPKEKKDRPDKELILKLIAACEQYDIDSINEAVAEMEKYQYSSGNELTDWIKDNVLEGNFEEIAQRLSSADL